MNELDNIFSFTKGGIGIGVDPVSTEIKLTGDLARSCLSLPQFKQYREQYEKMEAKVIDEMVQEAASFCASGDSIEKFGSKCLVKLTRIRDLRSLVTKIENDAKKDMPKKEE